MGEKSEECGTFLSHGGRDKSTEKHQPIFEGIFRDPGISSSHMRPQKIAKLIRFYLTTNYMMVSEQV